MNPFIDIKENELENITPIGTDYGNFKEMAIGQGSKVFRGDDQGIWAGAAKYADAPFRVDMEGNLVATSATISGAIDIGGADATSFHVDVDGNMWAGAATFAAAPFKVSNAGALTATSATITGDITATSGTIGGFTIASTYLYAGTGVNTCGLSPTDYPFWAGAAYADRATAPFRVTPAGAIVVTDITVNVSSQTGGGSGADFKYSGASRVLINGSGVLVRNTRGFFMEETTGGNYGSLTIGSDNIMVLKASETTDTIYFEDSDGNDYFKVLKQTVGSEKHAYLSVDSYLELLWRTNANDPDDGKVSDGSMWYNTDADTAYLMANGAKEQLATRSWVEDNFTPLP